MNPFKDRICKVFSSSGDGDMSFEDFLDMMSVFSDNAPKNVKVEYAFRIYGDNSFDNSSISMKLLNLFAITKIYMICLVASSTFDV